MVQTPEVAEGDLLQAFEARARAHGFSLDSTQRHTVGRFQRVEAELARARAARTGWLGRLRAPPAVRSLYLWGGVGRGKSFLMDSFHDLTAEPDRRRVHFHRFMQEIHASLRRLQGQAEPMEAVAAGVGDQARLLCLDEFQVTDIGDAMLMRKLLEGLLARGVCVVTTSNTPPARLYLHGLQRSQFLPAIALIESRFEVVHMDDGTDYRRVALERAGTWHSPDGPDADATLASAFLALTGEAPRPGTLVVEGREVAVRGHCGGLAWFDFSALCDGPRAQADYIELARRYETVLLSGVPVFRASGEADRMRRFTWLVDEFYDRRVKLMVTAAADAIALYSQVSVTAEQERTASRLVEMQTQRYLGEAHLG